MVRKSSFSESQNITIYLYYCQLSKYNYILISLLSKYNYILI